jgi:hypothetical protein
MHTVLRGLFTRGGKSAPVWRWALVGVASIVVLAGAGMLVTSTLGSDPARQPKGYELAATIDLAGRDMQVETIALFNLAEAGDAAIFLRITGIDTRNIEVMLVPLQGNPLMLLHSEDFSSEASVTQVQYRLPAGEYRIALTSLKSLGILKVYILIP